VTTWVLFYLGLVVIGLVVLALITVRLWRQVREFAREVSAAGEKIAAMTAELDQISATNR
jgi:hypothetical protein